MIYSPAPENIARAAQMIRDGAVVAFPTETVYGLGACAFDARAVEQLFTLKGRPHFDPLIVHLADTSQIRDVAFIGGQADLRTKLEKLSSFWPGPLSVVLLKKPSIPDIVTAGLQSVAVRIPSHPVALEFLKACALPIAAPSANPFGYISPTCAEHVEKHFGGRIEMIIDGGSCPVGVESTIVSLLDEVPVLLRHGAITLEMLSDALGEVRVISHPAKQAVRGGACPAPGMLREHYAPDTPVVFREEADCTNLPERVGLITFEADSGERNSCAFIYRKVLSSKGDLEEIARGLFAALHELDGMGLDLIIVDSCADRELGRAIMDRLTRATARS